MVADRKARRAAPAFAAGRQLLQRAQLPLPASARTGIHHDGGARHVRYGGRRHGRPGSAEHALRLDRRVEDRRGHDPADGAPARHRDAAAARPLRRLSRRPIVGAGQSARASLAARALQLRHRPGRLQLECRRQNVHAARQSLHHDVPVDDVPGRAPGAVQLQHLRPARRLCRLRQLHGRGTPGPRHRARDSHGQDHRAHQRGRRQLAGRRHSEQRARQRRAGQRRRDSAERADSRSSIWASDAWR